MRNRHTALYTGLAPNIETYWNTQKRRPISYTPIHGQDTAIHGQDTAYPRPQHPSSFDCFSFFLISISFVVKFKTKLKKIKQKKIQNCLDFWGVYGPCLGHGWPCLGHGLACKELALLVWNSKIGGVV